MNELLSNEWIGEGQNWRHRDQLGAVAVIQAVITA